MSIEMETQSPAVATPSSSKKEKSGKKHKSSEDKKRKRDLTEDGIKHKSKKHRSDKTGNATTKKDVSSPDPIAESPFHIQTSSLYLPLAPISQRTPLEGMCAEHLSPLLLTYYPPLKGVVLSYSKARMSEKPLHDDGERTLLHCIDEYAVSWAWVTAEFLLFKPTKHAPLEGYVNLQNEGHLGLVCWNLFNASIERERLPKDWEWIGIESTEANGGRSEKPTYAEDGLGYYKDGEGNKIEGMVQFRIRDIESSHDRERGFLSIAGTMLEEADEKELAEKESLLRRSGRNTAGRLLGGANALSATLLGAPLEPSQSQDDAGQKRKHRTTY